MTEQPPVPEHERDRGPATPPPVSAPPPRRGPRRAVRRGTEREDVGGLPADERGGHDSNDDRLRQDVPPHW